MLSKHRHNPSPERVYLYRIKVCKIDELSETIQFSTEENRKWLFPKFDKNAKLHTLYAI